MGDENMYYPPSAGDTPDRQPDGCVLWDDEFDIDGFLDRISMETAPAHRRVGGPAARSGRRSTARDDSVIPPRIDLILYTSAVSEKSQRAVRAVQDVLRGYDASQIKFATCDLSQRPLEGDVHAVVFTPTLVKQGPGPRTSIIGNLENSDVLRDLLDASGVDRRWDD
jgi:hypothetical protein